MSRIGVRIMNWIDQMQNTKSTKELRQFGLIMFLVLGFGFGLTFPLLAGRALRPLPLLLGIAFAICAALAPSTLSPIFKVWMKIGGGLGWINSRVILALIYYTLIVPYGLVMRIFGKDSMQRGWQKNRSTYREPVTDNSCSKRMEKPY